VKQESLGAAAEGRIEKHNRFQSQQHAQNIARHTDWQGVNIKTHSCSVNGIVCNGEVQFAFRNTQPTSLHECVKLNVFLTLANTFTAGITGTKKLLFINVN